MHSISQQQLQRRNNSTQIPLIYSVSSPSAPLLQTPPSELCYSNINTKHYQRGNGNRNNRGLSVTHRQQRTITGFRHHPYQFRHPVPPQRSFRSTQRFPHTPISLMGTPPGMSQSEYEPIHSEQVQRDKDKLVRHGHVLAPSNTTQFLIDDHNHQINNSSLTYDQMFEMNDDDIESIDQINIDSSFDDIYYQCRYERYAGFSHNALLNEVLSLCSNIDRLQHEKSEVEKCLKNIQQHIYTITTQSQNQDTSPLKIESTENILSINDQ